VDGRPERQDEGRARRSALTGGAARAVPRVAAARNRRGAGGRRGPGVHPRAGGRPRAGRADGPQVEQRRRHSPAVGRPGPRWQPTRRRQSTGSPLPRRPPPRVRHAASRMHRYRLDGSGGKEVTLSEMGSIVGVDADPDREEAFVASSRSPARRASGAGHPAVASSPGAVTRRRPTPTRSSPSGCTTSRPTATRVPMFLVRTAGTTPSPVTPTVLRVQRMTTCTVLESPCRIRSDSAQVVVFTTASSSAPSGCPSTAIPTNPEPFAALAAYSPYHHVVEGDGVPGHARPHRRVRLQGRPSPRPQVRRPCPGGDSHARRAGRQLGLPGLAARTRSSAATETTRRRGRAGRGH